MIGAGLFSSLVCESIMLTVSEDLRKQTTNCQKGFACLYRQENDLCQVDYALKGVPFVMIKKPIDELCPYSFHFGKSQFCSCPVRFELYKRYGI